jgi:carboxymethylenebutenolidase
MVSGSHESRRVEFLSNGDRIQAHLVIPEAAGPHPAVIVIQEIWGLNEHIQDIAGRFARNGYVALAPDLYSREGIPANQTLEFLRPFMMAIPDRRLVQDLRAAVAHLKGLPEVQADRIGAIGFCIGGAWALLLACQDTGLAACVDFYGRIRYPELSTVKPKHPVEHIPTLGCPFLGIFAGDDPVIPPAYVQELETTLAEHAKTFELHAYPGVPHAFFNDTRDSYRPEAAGDAWRRTLAFFARHLKR